MLGWFADSLRFAWALLYWNTRKSWFRLRRGYAACPCQAPSDSGRAFETGCDACWHWHRPERFRRVCPLLVETRDGLRCSVDAADVRPFWGITLRYYGSVLLAIYLAAVLTVFGFLRTIGYPVSIVHVAVPTLWYRVGQARGWFFFSRAQQAFAAGRTTEGLLYLANSYEFDPSNYEVGLALAKAFQVGQPVRSDKIFAELMREHPTRRNATAQHWIRALLARGDFDQSAKLAAEEVLHDPQHAAAWMRALLFASRQLRDETALKRLLAINEPLARPWHRLLETELLLRTHRDRAARVALQQGWPASAPAFTVLYRVEALNTLGDPAGALDLLLKHRPELDDEAYLTLRLDCLADAGALQPLRRDFDVYLLAPPLTQPLLKIMCAQLIRHPDVALFEEVCAKVARESMPLDDQTAGGWFSLLCTAGAVGDKPELHALTLRLRQASQTPFAALLMVEGFFNGEMSETRATSFLPFLPVPLEVTYALIERFPGPRDRAAPAGKSI